MVEPKTSKIRVYYFDPEGEVLDLEFPVEHYYELELEIRDLLRCGVVVHLENLGWIGIPAWRILCIEEIK